MASMEIPSVRGNYASNKAAEEVIGEASLASLRLNKYSIRESTERVTESGREESVRRFQNLIWYLLTLETPLKVSFPVSSVTHTSISTTLRNIMMLTPECDPPPDPEAESPLSPTSNSLPFALSNNADQDRAQPSKEMHVARFCTLK